MLLDIGLHHRQPRHRALRPGDREGHQAAAEAQRPDPRQVRHRREADLEPGHRPGLRGLRLLSAARSEPARTRSRVGSSTGLPARDERRVSRPGEGTGCLDEVLDVHLALLEQLEDPRRAGGGVDGQRRRRRGSPHAGRRARAGVPAAPRETARAAPAARTGRRRRARPPGRPWPARGGTGRPRPRTCTTPAARRRRGAARRRTPRRARPAGAAARRPAVPAAARPPPRPPRRTPRDRSGRARAGRCWSTTAGRRPRPRRGTARPPP